MAIGCISSSSDMAERLGKALAETRGLCFTHIFASTLQRAWMTAESVQKHQSRCSQGNGQTWSAPRVVQSELLLEQDFGSFELMKWSDSVKPQLSMPNPDTPGFKPRETAEAMKLRADAFIERFLLPLVLVEGEGGSGSGSEDATAANTDKVTVAVVSHGLFLQQLWKSLFGRFESGSVSLGPDAFLSSVPDNYRSAVDAAKWSNTAYLECTIRPAVRLDPSHSLEDMVAPKTKANEAKAADDSILPHSHLRVIAINRSDHLHGLKRDGVGSSPYDCKQQSIKAFFSKHQN